VKLHANGVVKPHELNSSNSFLRDKHKIVMADKMGGSSTAKVPAWKLRQQRRQNSKQPPALNVNDDLGGVSSRRPRGDDELGVSRGGSATIPAWKLRERSKSSRENFDDSSSVVSTGSTRSTGSLYSRSSVSSNNSSHPSRNFRPVSRVPGAADPSLPPAFRSAFEKQQQRKKNSDDFLSLSSVHSRSRTDGCSTVNSFRSDDSFGTLDSDDDSFDDEDSFASLDSDADKDDDAYRESRNQMARLKIEKQTQDSKRVGRSRFKKKNIGVNGTTLDFIAE